MKTAYLLHGCTDDEEWFAEGTPAMSNAHWFPWLQRQLLLNGFICQAPEMPTPSKPTYAGWKSVFASFPLTPETLVISHSAGGGFFLRWMSENPNAAIGRLIMVAPWMDPHKTCGDFLDYPNLPNLDGRVKDIQVFYSEDEPVKGVKETVDLLRPAYPTLKLHTFKNHGHFCMDGMKTEKFPELLKVALS